MKHLNKLILGTVQLGLNYGINNQKGKPSLQEAFSILDKAKQHGIQYLDTAAGYGNSEEIIGKYLTRSKQNPFKIITKLHVFGGDIFEKVTLALNKLSIEKIDVMLFHSFKDFKENPHLIEKLVEEKNKGKIGEIGVSVYHNNEIEALLEVPFVKVIQLPFNLLDNHFQKGALLEKAKNVGKIIHTRSAFLQGLFFRSTNLLPDRLFGLSKGLTTIQAICKQADLQMHELALAYVFSRKYIDGILIGVDSSIQLENNILASTIQLSEDLIQEIDNIQIQETSLLNPSNWNR